MEAKEYILKMSGINKAFPGVKALQNVNLEVEKGEVHALLGENGAGKSTLLKILSGAYQRDSGRIVIDGQEIEQLDPKRSEALGVAIIYQEFSSLPELSIAENIFLGHQPRKNNGKGLIDWQRCYQESRELLKRVGLNKDPRTKVGKLKVAEQQMVEIAKALVKDAKIIVMDEPSAPLTGREIDHLFKVIRELKKQQVAVIYVSHRLIEIKQICDSITVLRDGCFVARKPAAGLEIKDMIRLMVGRELNDMYPKAKTVHGEVILEAQGLVNDKLKNVDFTLRRGEILGIAGLVGAGRTELARAVFGADPKTAGTIKLNGTQVQIKKPQDAIRHKIGLVPEDRKKQGLVLMMNIKENITLASLKKMKRAAGLDLKKEEHTARNYVRKLSVATPGIFEETNHLSGGNQQKVVLSKWLCTNCNVLFIDEPTRGIDVGAKVEIYQLMNELVQEGMGIVMISSEMPELMGVCDRILVMHEGRITGELTRGEFSEERIMEYAAGQAG